MASLAYNTGKKILLDTLSGTAAVKLVLLAAYTPSATHTSLASVTTFAVGASGDYASITGVTLTGGLVTINNTAGTATLDFDDVVLHDTTITADTAVLYSTAAGSKLITAFDFGGDKISTAGTFSIVWSVSGVLAL